MKANIFLSYAHKDENQRSYVESHIKILELEEDIVLWSDRRIRGSGDWQRAILTAIDEADIFIPLISRYYLLSDFIRTQEVPYALKQSKEGRLNIYPLLISHVDLTAIKWLHPLQMRPTDRVPLWALPLLKRDKVMSEITRELRGII